MPQFEEAIGVLEAVDYLSSMSELDERKKKTVDEVDWRNPLEVVRNQALVRETFQVIHDYLQELYQRKPEQLNLIETQKGIQAIMMLAAEAAQKLDRFTTLFKGTEAHQAIHLHEYKQLQHLYLTKIVKLFQQTLQKESLVSEKQSKGAADPKGLKDLQSIRKDRHYELLYLKNDEGQLYADPELLKHLELVGKSDEGLRAGVDQEKDPHLWIREFYDREIHEGAKKIFSLSKPFMDEFYKQAMPLKNREFVASINKALMALFLAANATNLLENGVEKSCLSYYSDFHIYLRAALSSDDYQRMIENPSKEHHSFSLLMMNLLHMLCCFFFMRMGKKEEMVQLIHRIIKEGGELQKEKPREKKDLSLWDRLLVEDEDIRSLFKQYPSGPILKSFDAINEYEIGRGFDPSKQDNYPFELFALEQKGLHISVLHVPSPLKQLQIDQVELAEEFEGFLSYLKKIRKKHLLINLQDRSSWQESTRACYLEDLGKNKQIADNLVVITLPKEGQFYFQEGDYQNNDDASSFLKSFKENFHNQRDHRFYISSQILGEVGSLVEPLLREIHQRFFDASSTLTRNKRLSFIEIFYQFFILKCLEKTGCQTMSFTCKDGLDLGASSAAGFYAFVRMMTEGSQWNSQEEDFLRWLFYHPALVVRERAIDQGCLHRIISTLVLIDEKCSKNQDEIVGSFSHLYSQLQFKQLKVLPGGA